MELLKSPEAQDQIVRRRINALTWILCPWVKPPAKTNKPNGSTNAANSGTPSGTSSTASAPQGSSASEWNGQPPISVGGFAGIEQILQSPGTSSTESAELFYNYVTSITDPDAQDMDTVMDPAHSAFDLSFQVLVEPMSINPALVP